MKSLILVCRYVLLFAWDRVSSLIVHRSEIGEIHCNDEKGLWGFCRNHEELTLKCGPIVLRKISTIKQNGLWLFKLPTNLLLYKKLPLAFSIRVFDSSGYILPATKGYKRTIGSSREFGFNLWKSLISGHVIDKWGNLNLPFAASERKKNACAFAMMKLTKLFEEKFNLKLFIHYGTLLGYKRSGSFLPHDDDVDLSFFVEGSSHHAAEIFYEIVRGLQENSVVVDIVETGQMKVFIDEIEYGTDIFLSWGYPGGTFNSYFCVSHPIHEQLIFEKVLLEGYDVYIPSFSESLLRIIYGESWQIPDKNFVFCNEESVENFMRDFRLIGSSVRERFGFKEHGSDALTFQ